MADLPTPGLAAAASCNACDPIVDPTAVTIENAPGLGSIGYRIGTHGTFTASMHRAISAHAALDRLTTRQVADPAIGLVDAWATVLDVLTFYQERIANEGWLRTASERRSVRELARELGYRLRPATAAVADLAFIVEDSAGAPEQVRLDRGTKVQSQPDQDETPQVFETIAPIVARPAWNAMRPLLTWPQRLDVDAKSALLAGNGVTIAIGDLLTAISEAALADPGTGTWQLARVGSVVRDDRAAVTAIGWEPGLPAGVLSDVAGDLGPALFALRARAALFGYNAIPWTALPIGQRFGEVVAAEVVLEVGESHTKAGSYAGQAGTWADAAISGDVCYLDATYPAVVKDSWIVLDNAAGPALFKVAGVRDVVHTAFALTLKVTEVTLDREVNTDRDGADQFSPKNTSVLIGSEPLPLAPEPIPFAVAGRDVELETAVPTLAEGQRIILRGRAAWLQVTENMTTVLDDDGTTVLATVMMGDRAEAVGPPVIRPENRIAIRVRLPDDTTGWTNYTYWRWVPAPDTATIVAEPAIVELDKSLPGAPGSIRLTGLLAHAFDRATLVILANVARATHGESVREVLGGGDASARFQRFRLRRAPVTYLVAATETGVASTLTIWANDISWDEIASFNDAPCDARAYVTREDDDQKTIVSFGDGRTGAVLPTGVENVVADYRAGGGRAGRVHADQLNLLLSRPLGLAGVTNPLAAEGGTDAEAGSDARVNAPRSVLTLGRVVSEQDVEDFAAAFPGIGKAQANLVWDGRRRIVHLTVAADDGLPLAAGGPLETSLILALDAVRDPNQPLHIVSAVIRRFGLQVEVLVARDHRVDGVLAAVRLVLLAAFSFAARGFAEALTTAGVLSTIQPVAGVVAARVVATTPPLVDDRLAASTASSVDSVIGSTELLLLDPTALDVREMLREL